MFRALTDLAAIRKILETEAGATCCPCCCMPFDKGKKRKLIDTCGHAKCYTCMFRNESCTICANTQRHHQEMHDDIGGKLKHLSWIFLFISLEREN